MDSSDPMALAAALGSRPPWPHVLQLLQAQWLQRDVVDVVVASSAISCCSRESQWQVALELLKDLSAETSTVAVGAAISGAKNVKQVKGRAS